MGVTATGWLMCAQSPVTSGPVWRSWKVRSTFASGTNAHVVKQAKDEPQ